MKKAFISLGSNIGDRKKSIARAIRYINSGIGHTIDISGIYETEPWGFVSDNNFLNMVIEIISDLSPEEMMQKCLEIETKLGRKRNNSKSYSSRIIDIDILFYGDTILSEVDLTLPHPHLHNRLFILEPMHEIAPDFIHPKMNMTISELLAKCQDKSIVTQLGSMQF